MKKKNKQILGVALASAALISMLGYAFALFTSRDDADVVVKAGNLDVETVIDPVNGFTNKNSILPGNNDPSLDDETVTHEINFKVKNTGNTAIRTRQTVIVDLTKNVDEKTEIVNPQHVKLFKDETLSEELGGKSFLIEDEWVKAEDVTDEDLSKAKAISYRFVSDSFDGLDNKSQVREGAVSQQDEEVSKDYSYSFGLMKEAGNDYQEASINVQIVTEAIQFDNTDNTVFDAAADKKLPITSSTTEINVVPHKNEKAE